MTSVNISQNDIDELTKLAKDHIKHVKYAVQQSHKNCNVDNCPEHFSESGMDRELDLQVLAASGALAYLRSMVHYSTRHDVRDLAVRLRVVLEDFNPIMDELWDYILNGPKDGRQTALDEIIAAEGNVSAVVGTAEAGE